MTSCDWSVTLGWGRGRLGSCGLEAQDSGSRKRLQDFGLGEGAGPGGQGPGAGRGRKAGGGAWLGDKPLEALFPPAVKGRRQKMLVRDPIFTTVNRKSHM